MIVIGDYITDVFSMGECSRLSPEAPVPVITNIKKFTRAGGAGNVFENLAALSGKNPDLLCNPRLTSTKERIYANGHPVCRIDNEEYEKFDVDMGAFDLSMHKYAILSDYDKGVLHTPSKIIEHLNKQGIKSLVDPKKGLGAYYGAYLIKCNEKEFAPYADYKPFDVTRYVQACYHECVLLDFSYIIVTLGSNGFFLYDHALERGCHGTGKERFVVDVTGAGDVYMAALGHYIEQGDSVLDAAKKANDLAGISVEHLGTYVLTKEDIETTVKPNVVFTNGCFDILHPGHIHLLNESKKLGKKLIVGLNSDASVKRIKGPNRPILSQDQRKKMLEALGIADEVIIFDEDSPRYLITRLKPDIITKGGDYKPDDVVGADMAKVVIIPTLEDYSTTGVVNEVIRKS
jgi:D-beta-D-heptose 7-phosphate kinase / D-beta-D-heptose 1-phosphate adenosyltransferase